MSRISGTFEALFRDGRKALIPFVTAGDPTPALTVPLMHALAEAGADIIELGVPFSDPMADGPTIQRSSERALKYGVSLRQVLDFVREFRRQDETTPVVLMGYANPIEALGYRPFAEAAAGAGVDGVLVVDYPPEECRDLARELAERSLDIIFLVSPTTTEQRVAQIAELARGYVYYVSLKGVTGAAHLDTDEVAGKFPQLRRRIAIPIGVGFGIRDADTARRVAEFADAVVIGSRLVEEIEQAGPDDAAMRAGSLLRGIRAALDAGRGPS